MRARLTAIALLAAFAAGACAPPAPPKVTESQPIDNDFTFARASVSGLGEMTFAGKIEPRGGKVLACAAMGWTGGPGIAKAARAKKAELSFHVGDATLDADLRFATPYADALIIMGKDAACGIVGEDWRESFAGQLLEIRFERRETLFSGGG